MTRVRERYKITVVPGDGDGVLLVWLLAHFVVDEEAPVLHCPLLGCVRAGDGEHAFSCVEQSVVSQGSEAAAGDRAHALDALLDGEEDAVVALNLR